MDQQTQEFQVHLEELLQRFFEQLTLLRDSLLVEARQRHLLEGAFRSVHTIKGTAASMDLPQVVTIAHQIEELLSDLRAGRLKINQRELQRLEDAGNLLTMSLSSEPPTQESVEKLQQQVGAVHEQLLDGTKPMEDLLTVLPSQIAATLTEDQRQRLIHLRRTGAQPYQVSATFSVADFETDVSRLRRKLEDVGEVISTHPSVDKQRPDYVSFVLLFVSREDLSTLRSTITEFHTASINYAQPAAFDTASTIRESEAPVRLPVSEIDSVAEPLEMLFSTIRQSFRFALEKTEGDTQKKLIESQEAVEQAIEHVTAKLSEMRLVHAGQILERAARAGRAAAMACGKVVSIEIVGKDVLIDRIAASALSDSLVHLVRNAVDHGIESPEERSNSGKPLPATVRIEAECDESAVYFRVLDNGRGIDAEAVKVAATALGYSAANDALALEGCLQLIFQPGVSTKESTSETSGRGVGLDVVRQRVASIGGEVRVQTDPGKGSCFEIQILNKTPS